MNLAKTGSPRGLQNLRLCSPRLNHHMFSNSSSIKLIDSTTSIDSTTPQQGLQNLKWIGQISEISKMCNAGEPPCWETLCQAVLTKYPFVTQHRIRQCLILSSHHYTVCFSPSYHTPETVHHLFTARPELNVSDKQGPKTFCCQWQIYWP